MVSAEAIRILLWILGFLSFGYGTKEFEVTRDRLGCYRPEEHIDNPKVGYKPWYNFHFPPNRIRIMPTISMRDNTTAVFVVPWTRGVS